MTRKRSVLTPACRLGYSRDQVEQIMAERIARFDEWMLGQTVAICDGKRYDHDAKRYEDTGCGPHGLVTYEWDVERFLMGGPVLD